MHFICRSIVRLCGRISPLLSRDISVLVRRYLCLGPKISPPVGFIPQLIPPTGNLYPNLIEIGNWTTVAPGCLILTHYIDTNRPASRVSFTSGKVKIGRACFIGTNSVICNSMEIGDNSILVAGSIVTKTILSN